MAKEKSPGKKDKTSGTKRLGATAETIGSMPKGVSLTVGKFFVKKMEFDGVAAAEYNGKTDQLAHVQVEPDPNMKIEVFLDTIPLQTNFYEIDLTVNAFSTLNSQPYFRLSTTQAGVFSIKNASKKQLDFILKGYCPMLLYPYIRENISNIITRGGFKVLSLPMIDFMAIYQKSMQKQ